MNKTLRNHPARKLGPAEVTALQIMRREDGLSLGALSKIFKVSKTLVVKKCREAEAVSDGATH